MPNSGLVFLLLFPLLQCTCFYLAIGDNPKSLRLGVVNDEVADWRECFNSSLRTSFVHDYTCDLHLVSCRYLTSIPADIATLVYYDTEAEAYADAHQAKIIGYVHFASNFTDSLAEIRDEGRHASVGSFEMGEIRIRLDNSNQQISYFLERRLREIYGEFAQDLMSDCEFPKKLSSIPVRFETPIFGSFNVEYKQYAAPGVVMT